MGVKLEISRILDMLEECKYMIWDMMDGVGVSCEDRARLTDALDGFEAAELALLDVSVSNRT